MSTLQHIYKRLNVNSVLTLECEKAIIKIFEPLIKELKSNFDILSEIYEADPGFLKMFPKITKVEDIYETFLKKYVNLEYDQMFISDMNQTPKLIYWGISALMQLNDSNYMYKYEILLPISYYDWSIPENEIGYELLNRSHNLNYDSDTKTLINKIFNNFEVEEIYPILSKLMSNMSYNQVHEAIINEPDLSDFIVNKYTPFNEYENLE